MDGRDIINIRIREFMDPAGRNLSRREHKEHVKAKITLLGMEISNITASSTSSSIQKIKHLYNEAVQANEMVTGLRVSGENLIQRVGNAKLSKKAKKVLEKLEKLAIDRGIVLDRGDGGVELTPKQNKLFREISGLVQVSGKGRDLKFAHVNSTLGKLLKKSIAAKNFSGLFKYLEVMIKKTKPGTKGHSKLLILQGSLANSLEVNDICEQSLSKKKLQTHEGNILHSRNINPALLQQYEEIGKTGLSKAGEKQNDVLKSHIKKIFSKHKPPFSTRIEVGEKTYTLKFRVTSKGKLKVKIRDMEGKKLLMTNIFKAIKKPIAGESSEVSLGREVLKKFLLEAPSKDLESEIEQNPDLGIEYPGVQILPLSAIEKIENKIQEALLAKISISKMLTHVRALDGAKYNNSTQTSAHGTPVSGYELRKEDDGRIRFTFQTFDMHSDQEEYVISETDTGKLEFIEVDFDDGSEYEVSKSSDIAEVYAKLATCVPKLYANVNYRGFSDGVVVNQLDLLLKDDPLGMLSTYADTARKFKESDGEVLPVLSSMQNIAHDVGGPTQDLLTKAMPIWMDAARKAPPKERIRALKNIGTILAKSYGKFLVPRDPSFTQIGPLVSASRNFTVSKEDLDRNLLSHALELPGNEKGTSTNNRLERAFMYSEMIDDMEGVFSKQEQSQLESKEASSTGLATNFADHFGTQEVADDETEAIADTLSDILTKPPIWKEEKDWDEPDFENVTGLIEFMKNPLNKEAVIEFCKRRKTIEMDDLVMTQDTREEVEVLAKAMGKQDRRFVKKVSSADFNRKLVQSLNTAEVAAQFHALATLTPDYPSVSKKLTWIATWIERGDKIDEKTGLKGLSKKQTEKLLTFITGAPSLPVGREGIRISSSENPEAPFSAKTCFNQFNLSEQEVTEEQFYEQIEITLQATLSYDLE